MEEIIKNDFSDEGEFCLYQLRVLENRYTYLLAQGGVALSIDPCEEVIVMQALKEINLTLEAILITHYDEDHIKGALPLKGDSKVPIIGPKHKDLHFLDQEVCEGDEIFLGPFSMEVIHAPGHTMEHLMYYFSDLKLLFCGDVLTLGGCGEMIEGNEHHYFHVFEKIRKLPTDTRILTNHDDNIENILFIKSLDKHFSQKEMKESDLFHTLKHELKINPFLKADSPQKFLEIYRKKEEFNSR